MGRGGVNLRTFIDWWLACCSTFTLSARWNERSWHLQEKITIVSYQWQMKKKQIGFHHIRFIIPFVGDKQTKRKNPIWQVRKIPFENGKKKPWHVIPTGIYSNHHQNLSWFSLNESSVHLTHTLAALDLN
jgi:hypothetical protein